MDGMTADVDQKDYTKDYYELDHARYEQGHSFSLTRIKRVMGFLEPGADDVIADIGCGVGTFSLELAPRVKRVYAIDFSQDALDILNRLKEKRGYKNIIPIRSSVDDIDLPDGVVDAIVSADLVEHLYDAQFRAFAVECRRILKPGGCMVIYTPNILTDFKKKAKKFYGPVKKTSFKLLGISPQGEIEQKHNEKFEYLHVGYKSIDDIVSTLMKNEFVIEATRYFELPAPFSLGNVEFIRKNFAKRYLIKCRRQ